MKLVLLEALIVMVAMRAVLSLSERTPLWPPTSPLWDVYAAIALAAAAWIAIEAARRRLPRLGPHAPPRIPLERIAPYRADALLVRFGARGRTDISLN